MYKFNNHGMYDYSVKRNIHKLFHDFNALFWAQGGRQPFYQREERQPVVTHRCLLSNPVLWNRKPYQKYVINLSLFYANYTLLRKPVNKVSKNKILQGFFGTTVIDSIKCQQTCIFKIFNDGEKYKINYLGEKNLSER